MIRSLRTRALLLVVLVALAAACSGGGEAGPTIDTSKRDGGDTGIPVFTGQDVCTDVQGDVEGAVPDTPAEVLAQVDLKGARVSADDEVLHVEFDAVGADLGTDELRFTVAKGRDTLDPGWFEIWAVRGSEGWTVTVHTLEPVQQGQVQGVEQQTELATPVHQDGGTVTYDVRLADLPALDASQTWQYGARLGGSAVVTDLCSPFDQ
jgi:hypothetical protein